VGGPGLGHKSERARLARLANMAKARAARKREPLRWRSGLESRIIEQLVWQWWLTTSGPSLPLRVNERLVASDWKTQLQIPGRVAPRNENRSGWNDASGKSANREIGAPGKPWAKQRVARLLGVSHTWVNKLVKRFEADPDRMRRRMAAFAPATLEKLERAREETRRQRDLGWLRGPIRMRRVKWTLGGKAQRAIVWTHSERRRREAKGPLEVPVCVRYAELPPWARGVVPAGGGVTGHGRRRW